MGVRISDEIKFFTNVWAEMKINVSVLMSGYLENIFHFEVMGFTFCFDYIKNKRVQ